MAAVLTDRGGPALAAPGREDVERRLGAGRPFWLDLHGVGPAEAELLREVFGFHPLAVEDAEHFGQRAKVEVYDDFAFVVAFGAVADEDGLVEVHCFHAPGFLVTVHHDPCPPLDALRRHWEARAGEEGTLVLLHRLLDGLTDSFFPALDRFDAELDDLENRLERGDTGGQKERLYALRRRLATLRRAVQGQRDLLGRLASGSAGLADSTPEAERRFRDVYDHLIRLTEQAEVYREVVTGANEMYQSAVSQRSNEVLRRLTIISTIFLPLTFVVGFFGQNFGWMVANIDTLADFLVLGIGGLAVSLVALVAWFRRRGWL